MSKPPNTMNPDYIEKQPLLDLPVTPAESQSSDQPQPTLAELRQKVIDAQREYQTAWRRIPVPKWKLRIIYAFTACWFGIVVCLLMFFGDDLVGNVADPRVPLDVHIMSKCPDARDCLHDMILPAMVNVSRLVDFNLDFIGKETSHDSKTNQTEIACMHGPEECLGNILELCAARLYPSPKIYLGFTMCLSHSYSDIPGRELVEDCALEHGIDISKLNACAIDDDGRRGSSLLRHSVEKSEDAGVKKSCTVRLGGDVRCIRDGGEWKDCPGGSTAEDLVRDVRKMYAKKNEA